MFSPKKAAASIVLISIAGTAFVKATDLIQAAINWWIESQIIDAILKACVSGFAYLQEKYDNTTQEKANGKVKNALRSDDRNAKPRYIKVKIPELKRHVNFVVLKNMSKSVWTFQVANLTKAEIAAKNEKGLPESGTVSVYKGRKDDKEIPLELMGVLEPGGEKVELEPGVDYFIYPNIAGKVGGIKAFAEDFNRTVYLADSRNQKYACNLMRKKESGAKVSFGVTFNSWPAVQANKGLELDLKNPQFDDMFFIMKDTIATPPRLPN